MKIIFTIKTLLIISTPMFSQQMVNWSLLNLNDPANLHARAISVVDTNIVWGTLSSSPGVADKVFRTTDGGQNFDVFTLPLTISDGWTMEIFGLDGNTAYVATTNGNGGQVEGIHMTTDGGQNWNLIFVNADEDFTALKIHFFNPLDGFVYGWTGAFDASFYYTEDGGDTWVKSDSEFMINSFWTEGGNDGMAVIGDTAWCSNVDGRIFYSIDKGHSWNSSPIGNTGRDINDIAFKNNSEGLAISSADNFGNDVPNILYKTEDGGLTWSTFSSLPNTMEANSLSYIPGTEGAYIITSGEEPTDHNFLFTLDNGNTWVEAISPYSLTSAEFLSPTFGFGGSSTNDSGLLKYNDNIFSVSTPVNQLETVNGEFHIYPNPVFTTANVSMENDWYGQLQFQIVDLLGHKVFYAKMEKVNRSAIQEFDLTDLPEGMYNLLLSNGEKTTTATFIKMR